MGKIHKNFFAIAFCAAFLFLMSFGAFGQTPYLTTSSCENQRATTVTAHGEISNYSNVTITEVGFIYATTEGDLENLAQQTSFESIPAESKAVGTKHGDAITATLTGLTPSTEYYCKAYIRYADAEEHWLAAVNYNSFETAGGASTFSVGTLSVYDFEISMTGAVLRGVYENPEGVGVTERGFLYSDDQNIYSATVDNLEGNVQRISCEEISDGYFTASIEALNPATLYYYKAYVTNTNGTEYGSVEEFTTLGAGGNTSNSHNGHDYVDLGLPSGTMWATMNVGATSPEEYGDYFAWGETEPKESYQETNYRWCNGDGSNGMTKYCNNSSFGDNGFTDDLTTLEAEDDAATVNWGGNWRMPTQTEMQELVDNCDTTWTTQNNVAGMLFTSRINGNTIFLPATGRHDGSGLIYADSTGFYWSSSLAIERANSAWRMGVELVNGVSSTYITYYREDRYEGSPVRPVYKSENTASNENIIFQCDFEDDEQNSLWTLNNASQTNHWHIGSAANNGGSKGLYITNDDGISNEYDNTATSYAYATIPVWLPQDGNYQFDFDWMANGENEYDNMKAFLVPLESVPSFTDGTTYGMTENTNTTPGGWIDLYRYPEIMMAGRTIWEHNSKLLSLTEGSYNLVFFWKNNESNGTNPPAAVDNIVISSSNNHFEPTDYHNGYAYVDLGLPSGTMWATMNIGASSSEEYGDYYAWGETEPHYSAGGDTDNPTWRDGYEDGYEWTNYRYCNGSSNSLTKYCYDASHGNDDFTDTLTILEAVDDAATVNWGAGWRMPTQREFQELMDNCTIEWSEQRGVRGCSITGPNNNSIFLPATGTCVGGIFEERTAEGNYLSSSLDTREALYNEQRVLDGMAFAFYSPPIGTVMIDTKYIGSMSRCWGVSIRPVYKADNTASNDGIIFQCDFEDTEQNSLWELNTTSQTNYWHIGSAVNNGGSNALYITQDGGASNEYDTNNASYSYATIQVWIGEADNYQFDFDWMANGEYNYDNMRAFLVSLDAVPNFVDGSTYGMEGDNNTTPAGWIDLYSESGIMEGQTSWQHNSKTVALEEGGYNLVFFWKNNVGGGFDPPAAVDNIVVSRETQTASNPSDPTDYINGYGYVDLGLPSGTMWATMNVGANSPEDGGKHYAWGETQHKETYDWTTYSYCNGSETSLTKYCSNSEYGDGGITDDLTVLEAMDDAAVANWGEGWRLPTQIEMQELVDNCDKIWTTYNGVAGMLFTSRNNGNSIFLPGAGLCSGSDPSSSVSGGYYWSSSLDADYPHRAWDLFFGSDDCTIYYSNRIYGQSVRAVYKAENTASNDENIIFQCDFEDDEQNSLWSLNTASQTNHWHIGSAASNGGSKGLYITSDDGISNEYDNTATSYAYATIPVWLPQDGNYQFDFDWRARGEYDYDNMRAFLVPWESVPSFTDGTTYGMSSNNNETPGGWIDLSRSGIMAGQSNWLHNYSKHLSLVEGSYNLVFFWKNDDNSDGDNPPAAVDNIVISREIPLNISDPTDYHNGYGYVDLGLPSGTMWATMNIGATSPEEYGNYYAWGETEPKDTYEWSTYRYYNGSETSITKYLRGMELEGITDTLSILEPSDDAATVNWGNGWSIPSADEMFELYECTWTWTTYNNVSGFIITGLNGNSIFLPAANCYCSGVEVNGAYWMNCLDTGSIDIVEAASVLYFIGEYHDMGDSFYRSCGVSVRPVYKAGNTASNETGTFTDDRDGRTYDYVVIGDQTWMAENLRYDNSGSMTVALSGEQSTTDQYLYYPNGLSENLETYGYLYNWPAAMNGESSSDANPSGVQGICPNGWHLPSDAEWSQLEDALGGTDNAGAMLAGNAELWVSGDLTESEHFGTSGFLALPAGRYDGSFGFLGTDAYFWSATERSSNYVYYRDIYNDYTNMNRDSNSKDYSYSIRCVKNEGNTASNSTGSHNGHEYVDLGLSVKWATVNIGAEAPDEEGNLYAWGEKETKSLYDWINYEHCEGYDGMINKYFTNENIGVTDPDNLTTLLPEDDAVTVNWGAGWRMPTSVEVEELINNCTINGSTISGNGNSITMNSASYWTSSLYLDNQNNAYIFDNSNGGALSNDERSSGYPVRGVYDATLALPTVITDSLSNLGATSVYLYGTVIEEEGVPTATDFGFKYSTDIYSFNVSVQGVSGTVGFISMLSGLQPGTTYYYRAYATNENGTGYGEIKNFTTPSGEYGGHAYIDLGLSSGTLWATCNVGADRPEGYGNYYAWGETTPKDEYTWSTYQHANGTTDEAPRLTKYCNDAGYGDGGFVDNLTTLELENDAASVNWGTGWRMPTRDEIKELVDSCIWAWEEPNGIAGYRVTGRNGNSIFLPAAGLHYADAFISEGSSANYWSNTLEQGELPISASNISMFTDNYYVSGVYRYLGYSVRAIFQKSPTVITNSATEISTTTANLQGKIVSSGISDVTARGFIYGTDSENLTDSIASTDNTDEFSVSLSNLESGKRYYFKAFAANDDGVSYGSVRGFRTLGPPNVTVYYPEWRDTTSVSLKASVEAGGVISSNKFYIGTDRSSLSEVSGEVNFSNTDSTYTLNVYDLLPETLYWAVAESGDEYGSRKGDTISFYTYGHFVDARDDTDYRTIQIGDQIWMAENLRFATDIQVGADTSSTVAYRYYPNGDEANTSTYGYLYNWKATMNGASSSDANPSGVQGICPDGWHLPSNSEWEQLENFLGSEKAASKLAGSASLWYSNYGACLMLTDSQFASSGFNAVPSGVYYTQYYVFGQEVAFWSATKYDETNVYTRYFYATRTDLVTSDNEPVNGYSVRCVKSAPTVATNSATNVTPTSATLIGSISNAASSGITARGFMFGTDSTSLTQNLQSTDNTADFTYTLSDLTANTTYYFKAYATIDGETKYGEVYMFRTPTGQHGEYYYVDLGLTSGTMWATCNVGANSSEGYGNYYAWGEVTTKDSYTQDNYTYPDNPATLPAEADAVSVNWGGGWFTPTASDLEELSTNCTSEWTSIDGVYGRVFTGQNGNSIFLPAAGRFTDALGSEGTYGDYWSSSLSTANPDNASYIYFRSYGNATVSNSQRYYGYTVRGVFKTIPTVATLSATDVSPTSAVLHGIISNVGNSEVTARGFKFGTSSDNLTETLTSTDNTEEFSYTVSDLEGGRTYYYRAFATNSDGTSYGEIKNFVVPSGQLAGHDYIDLGLPSGILWATSNIGATNPEDTGDKYAWGETSTKDEYTQDNYTYSDNPERLPADHDVVAVNWGEGWHTPTSADFEELINNCTSEYTTLNDVNGYVFTGPNGNSIFIPRNYYWSSSIDVSTQTSAYALSLNGTSPSVRSSNRYYGDYIRGVYSVPEVALSYPVWRDSIAVSLKAKYTVNGVIQSSKYYVGTAKNNLSEVTEGVTLSSDEHLLTVNVYDLEPRTQYWAMAEIVDEYGTFRSDTLSFYTYGSFVDSRNSTTYYTIQIGEQTWMAENLKYVGNEVSLGATTSDSEPFYYYPDGDEANVTTYGYLYNWPAIMNGEESSDKNPSGVQGICPNGWHLPSNAEWTQLVDALGGEENAGAMLAGRDDLWENDILSQSEYFGTTGFAALPAGTCLGDDEPAYWGQYALFWSTSEYEDDNRSAFNYDINYGGTNLGVINRDKSNGTSVRCVKGTTIYAYDTVNYCGEQYTFGAQTLTASGDYEETFTLGTDKDSVVYLHLTMNPAPTASISASTIHCSGQTATLTNTASGGTAPYTYNWTADAGITLGETSVTTTETSYNNTATPTFSECSASFSVNLSVTDANGCTANATPVTINVERDDFTLPANGNSTVACIDQATEPTPPTVNDNCGNTLTPSVAAQGGTYNDCSGTRTYTFTYTDCEGNEHDWVYTYTITPEDFDMPANDGTTVACASEATEPTPPAVNDNCGNTLTPSAAVQGGTYDGCSGTRTYTFTYTDCAGNSHDWVYTYTIEHSTAPSEVGGPVATTGSVECLSAATAPTTLPVVKDVCGNTLTAPTPIEGGTFDGCSGTKTYTYTYEDCSGLQFVWVYTYTITNSTAPTLTGTWPSNITGQNACFADRDISGLISDDDVEDLYTAACGTISVTHSDVEVSTDNCGWTVTRTYIITDGCNQTTKTQSISGSDQTAPTIGDASLSRELTSTNCTFIVPDLTEEVRAISSDNCSANADLTITQIPVAGTEITDEIVVTVTITVTDQCGLSSTKDVTLTIPDELTTSLTAGTIACNGGTTDITNEVAGGTSPYTYYWTDDTHSQNNEGVGAGNYTVTVTDTNGCSATSSIAVTQPNALTATLSATEINCHGQTSDISNTVAGGTEPYTYHWSNDATTQDLEGVGGGTYSVTVTDSNACTATASATVNEPAELTSELAAGTATCNGGTADIENTVSGGTAPLTYIWSNGNNTQNLTGVVAGEYTVTVTDAKGCSVVKTTEITQPDVLAVTLNAGTIACNGETTTVSTEVVGGTQPYTYAWNNDATTENLTDAVAGTYSVTVTDANTCSTTAVTTITEPSELTVTISGPTSVCENTTTTLTANAQGGTTDYTYLWNTTATTSSITTPAITTETSYSVTVNDANGCSVTESVTVEIGDTPGITISDVTPICLGGDILLQANVSNAGTDYTVEWTANPTSGAGLPDNLTTDAITVTPTEAGSYTYTVSLTATSCSDGQPFESTADVALTVNPLPDVTIVNNADTTVITCNTTQIELTATGGTLYQWSNGATTATTSITAPETYIVTVTDANGCTNTESITLTQDVTTPTVSITNTTGTELLTCTTTAINVLAEGTGTSYLWSNDTATATNTFTEGGTYTVTATADNGCTSTANIQITPNSDAPTLSITNNTGETILTCSLTSIIVTAEGSGASYEWSNGARTAETTLTEAGTYTVTTTATNGCTASTQITITANLEEPEIIATATDSTICQGSSTTLTASGGSSYTWSPETGLPSTVGATLTASPTTTTTYTVTGIGTNGCAGSGNVVITVNLPTASEITQIACESFEWNGTTYTETGDFTQTFTNANGCDSVVTLHLTINNSVTNEISDSACESYEWYGQTYTETGDYEYTLTAVNGCDSVVTLHLTINQPTESNDTVTTCGSYEWFGQTYTETGDYVHTLQSVNGCDSVVNLHLTINQPTEGNDTVIACDNYEWFGQTYTETGDYVHTLQSVNGCDSIVNLHLTINSSTTGEFADQMCSGVPYEYEGHTYTEAGTYHVTLVNANGCDSVVTLTLTYSNSCGGIISGVITDAGTDEAIPNARVTVGNQVTRTNDNGEYSLEVVRGLKTLRVSAEGYVSHYEAIDIQSDTVVNIAIYKPEISMDVDSISVTTYPYLAQYDSITITNTGNTALVWSSVSEYDSLALLPYDEEAHQRRNSRNLWDSIQTFTTQFNAEQAIATDGFFIYTSSWQRPGEFNRYTPDGEYIETFYIENVGMIRNLSFDGTYFYGTEASNIIFKLDLDNQTLVDSITTDISNIRHCSFDRQNGNLLAGDWNSLYSIDTATGVSTQIRDNLMNVYSSAYDNLSPGGPYLWLFSQASQNNGPSAYIRQFSIGNADYTEKTHYLDDLGLGNASLAGGICASEYVCEGKFVLLADIQNPSGNNIIATYEIGRTNNIVSPEKKSGRIMPNESLSIGVREHAVGVGEYEAKIRYRAAVMGNSTKDVNVTVTAIAPECDAVQQITAVTDTFYNVTLNWQPIELGEYNSVSYLIFGDNSPFAIDTTTETSITFERLSVGEHCFNVRALSVGDYSCLSESSDTVCAEIEPIPCNVALAVSASNDGESIFLTWNKPVGVEYFRIYRDDNAVEEVLYDGRYTDSNVVPEVTYCYTIFAYFEDGICNEIVGTACTKIVSGVCAESPVLQIEAVGYSVHLNWTVSSESYAYKIFRNEVYIGLTTDTTYFDNVNPGYNYCYRVESLCEYGMFAYSNEECVFVELIPEDDDENGQGSGDEDAIAEWTADNLTVYPNPTYGQFFIEGQRIATVMIYNASGQIVVEFDNNESERISIDCDGWNPGLYSIRIISVEGQVATRKISIFR